MEISNALEFEKFELVTAKRIDGELKHSLLAGFAIQFEGDLHYVLRLSMLPNIPYYLNKNRDSESYYTLFAKILKDPETGLVRFQNPIGSGKLLSDLKSHLEVRLPLFGTSVFMNLFPRT